IHRQCGAKSESEKQAEAVNPVPQQFRACQQHEHIGDAVENRLRVQFMRPDAEPDADGRERQQDQGGAEVLARELAEEGAGNKPYIVDGEKEPHGCADIERLVELLRQHVELQRRPARMGDKTGEAGNRAPETAFLKARLRHPTLWYFADIVIEGEGNAEEAEDKLDDIGAQIVEEEIAGGD